MENTKETASKASSPLPETASLDGYEFRSDGPPPFKWSHLWGKPIVNPVNLKSYTLPVLNLNNPYSRAFHLSWCE